MLTTCKNSCTPLSFQYLVDWLGLTQKALQDKSADVRSSEINKQNPCPYGLELWWRLPKIVATKNSNNKTNLWWWVGATHITPKSRAKRKTTLFF